MEDSEDYANGKSPFSRKTQYAEGLEDMVGPSEENRYGPSKSPGYS